MVYFYLGKFSISSRIEFRFRALIRNYNGCKNLERRYWNKETMEVRFGFEECRIWTFPWVGMLNFKNEERF
jgi:hypothetical protein